MLISTHHDHFLIPNYIGLKGLDGSFVDYQANIFTSMDAMKYCYVSSKSNIVPTVRSQHQCSTVEIGQGALVYTHLHPKRYSGGGFTLRLKSIFFNNVFHSRIMWIIRKNLRLRKCYQKTIHLRGPLVDLLPIFVSYFKKVIIVILLFVFKGRSHTQFGSQYWIQLRKINKTI